MPSQRAYLDWNASAPLLPAARAAMLAVLDLTGNASSVHAEGRALRQAIENARHSVARLTGAQSGHVFFTSGATEAASTLLTPAWRMGRSRLTIGHLFVCAADHPCLLTGGRFPAHMTTQIGVDADGLIDLTALEPALANHDISAGPPLVAIHLANNETGVVQPAREIAAMVKRHGGVLVVDAVQAAGRIPLDISVLSADFLILSSHKIGGPKGAGAVVARADLMMPEPLVTGGGQEKGHRAGTENVAAISGFGAAAAEALAALSSIETQRAKRDRIEQIVLHAAPNAVIYGAGAPRLANTSFFALPQIKAETAQIAFDLAGVAVSAGSACSSGKVGPSHVLKAMGFGDSAGALRVSIGPATTDAEIAMFADALNRLLARTRPKAVA
jgi:cysteine desulfurase